MKPVTGNITGYRLTGNRLTTLKSTDSDDFLVAAWSATSPMPVAAVSAYDVANVLPTVTSQTIIIRLRLYIGLALCPSILKWLYTGLSLCIAILEYLGTGLGTSLFLGYSPLPTPHPLG